MADINVPRSVADPVDDAIATLLEARTDRYRWATLREDPEIAKALRALHIIVFSAKVGEVPAA